MMIAPFTETLLSISRRRSLGEKETVFHTGQPAEAIFRVTSGEVHLYRHSREGRRVLLYRAYAGDYFAEASLNAMKYHCTALCTRATELQVFDSRKMRELLSGNAEFALAWIAHISAELRRQRASVERLNLKSASDRVSHYLMTEGDSLGRMRLRGTLSELAEVLGISRETLYRTLASMQRQGILSRNGNTLELIE